MLDGFVLLVLAAAAFSYIIARFQAENVVLALVTIYILCKLSISQLDVVPIVE